MISEVTGVNQSKGTQAAKAIGSVTAGATTGLAIGLCVSKKGIGALIGAIAGTAISIGKLIFDN